MHVITPIAQLSREEVIALARAAADSDAPQHEANPFAPGTPQHLTFSRAYWARHRELWEVEA